MRSLILFSLLGSFVGLGSIVSIEAQTAGVIRGTVSAEPGGQAMHGARVVLSPLGRSVDSDESGHYEFTGVAAGTYDVLAESPGLSAERVTVQLAAGDTATADLHLRVAPFRQALTVTATGREEVATNALQSVTVLDMTQLPSRSSASLGEVLQGEPGIAKRSSGPGSGRPVVRGFDGDRVLVLQDGISTGTLSSSSGDHGEPVDVNQLERLEVVRGPATLLYGSNAIGGVVNAVSRHDVHQHAAPGVRAFLTGTGGTNNGLGGSSGGVEYGVGKWQFWGSGGGQRTGNYKSSAGEVLNSQARMEQAQGGLGRYGERAFATFNYGFTDSRYGVPYNTANADAEIPELKLRRNNFRGTFGLRNVSAFDSITARLDYSDYSQQELVENNVETEFANKQLSYRVTFDQKKMGRLTGTLGVWGVHRDYQSVGAETLAPATKQNGFAVFTVQNVDVRAGTRVQVGGRLEHNGYTPVGARARSFTGFSGSAGVSQRLWEGGAFAVNFTHSFRAPALEELYNNGPHPGNATFEIGNVDLMRERSDGVDVSLRHQSSKARVELNYFYYRLADFIFFRQTGQFEDGLPVANYEQGSSRYRGFEARFDAALHRNLWLNLGADAVNARLTADDTPLPRIPPVRGRVGVDARFRGFSVKPELVLSNAQRDTYPGETATAGYAVANLQGSYTIAQAHAVHVLSVNVFNAGDALYRNHLSLLKAFAPEIGRGVRFTYSLQVF